MQIVENGNEAGIVTLPRDHRIKISYSQKEILADIMAKPILEDPLSAAS